MCIMNLHVPGFMVVIHISKFELIKTWRIHFSLVTSGIDNDYVILCISRTALRFNKADYLKSLSVGGFCTV